MFKKKNSSPVPHEVHYKLDCHYNSLMHCFVWVFYFFFIHEKKTTGQRTLL